MMLFPAIDLRGGRCVRLYQGDYGRESAYDVDPVRVAEGFAEEGARWVHVVDLDAARSGVPENRATVAAIAAAVGPAVAVQVGGGVRDRRAVEALLEAGAARVVIGTVAVEDPDLVRKLASEYPVVVGLDARDGEVAVHGWTVASGLRLGELVTRYAESDVVAIVVTDIGRDGTLSGPGTPRLAEVLKASAAGSGGRASAAGSGGRASAAGSGGRASAAGSGGKASAAGSGGKASAAGSGGSEVDVIASGGVGSLSNLEELARLEVAGRRLAGVIVGKALHEGVFSVKEAIAACEASG